MITLPVSGALTLSLYDSIKDMPADLFQTARQYEVLTDELGQDREGLDDMLVKAENYALAGKMPEFKEQLYNYRLARTLVLDKFQANQLDWGCYVHSANGQPITDYSEDALVQRISDWSALGLTQGMIETSLEEAKKKLHAELVRYFPKRFNEARNHNRLEQVRQYLMAQLRAALEPDDEALRLKLGNAFGAVVGQTKPINLRPENSDLVEMEKGWGKLCVALAEHDCPDPKGLTLFDLYTWLEALEEKAEAMKKTTHQTAMRK